MKPTKETIIKILDKLDELKAKDDKKQQAIDSYVGVIARSSYSPIIEDTIASAYIDGVCDVYSEFEDILSYYLYEIPSMDTCEEECNGKHYNLKNRDEFIEFILL